MTTKPKTPAQIASWALEIQQVRIAHQATEAEIHRLRAILHLLLEKSTRQQTELTRQELALAAALCPPSSDF
jgi:hypothetical protein